MKSRNAFIGGAFLLLLGGVAFLLRSAEGAENIGKSSNSAIGELRASGEGRAASPSADKTPNNESRDGESDTGTRVGEPDEPHVNISQTKAQGGIDSSEVDTMLTAHHQALLSCYTDALQRTPELETRVEVNATMTANGPLGELAATMTVVDDAMRKCILDELSKVKFPNPETGFGSVIVGLSFRRPR